MAAGLLKSSGNTYDLTEAGRAVHSNENGGFCYAAGHEVTRVMDISSLPSSPFWGEAVEAVWLATVEISPKDLKPWILDTNLLKALPDLSRGFLKNAIETGAKATTFRANIVKLRGESKLRVRFNMAPGGLGSI